MGRVVHVRIHGVDASRAAELRDGFEALVASREWRGERPWLADAASPDLFAMEYFRHAAAAAIWEAPDAPALSAAGFARLGGDETDALALLFALRELSEQMGIVAVLRDPDNPIAKLRVIELRDGRLPDGAPLEAVLV